MSRATDLLTPDLFPGAPAGRHRPHFAAARRAFDAMRVARHPAAKRAIRRTMVEHLKASIGERAR